MSLIVSYCVPQTDLNFDLGISNCRDSYIWEKNGLFRNAKFDFKIYPCRFPENALCSINNAFVSIDNGKILWECVLLGQVIPMREPVEDKKLIEQSDHLVNNMNVSLYESGKFSGIGKTTGYIMLRGKKKRKILAIWKFGV